MLFGKKNQSPDPKAKDEKGPGPAHGVRHLVRAFAIIFVASAAAVIVALGVALPREEWARTWNDLVKGATLSSLAVAEAKDPSQESHRSFDPRTDPELFVYYPGLNHPATTPAAEAKFSDEEEVIGICVGDKTRAYRVWMMGGGPQFHVINDVIDSVPVSVTYCDVSHCAKVFTSSSTQGVLDIGLGGWHDGKMVLTVGNHVYYQKTEESLPPDIFAKGSRMDRIVDKTPLPFPYQEKSFERTTWKKWKEKHPDTDVYWLYQVNKG